MDHKAFPARVKVLAKDGESSGSDSGQFEALVSVFGNVDRYGDRVMPGAFERTLGEWQDSGAPIPIYWSHRLDDPDFNLGHVLEAKEIDKGLWVKGQLDPESPKAATTLRLMKGSRVNQFSFSYEVPPGGAQEGEDGANELTDLNLFEVGPTPVGANPETELLAVKAQLLQAFPFGKAGRVLSAKSETLVRNARDALDALLKAAAGNDDDDDKASQASRVKDEAGHRKSEEPHAQRSAPAWSTQLLLATLEAEL